MAEDAGAVIRMGALMVWCCIARPVAWRAPAGWYVNGVRPDGAFEARPVLGRPGDDLRDAVERRDIADDRALYGRLYCTGGSTPRQDGTEVWCQRS